MRSHVLLTPIAENPRWVWKFSFNYASIYFGGPAGHRECNTLELECDQVLFTPLSFQKWNRNVMYRDEDRTFERSIERSRPARAWPLKVQIWTVLLMKCNNSTIVLYRKQLQTEKRLRFYCYLFEKSCFVDENWAFYFLEILDMKTVIRGFPQGCYEFELKWLHSVVKSTRPCFEGY